MRSSTIKLVPVGVFALTTLVGCPPPPPKPGVPAKAYSVHQVVSMTEQNTRNLTKFRSKGGRLSARIPTDKGPRQYDLDGVLVLYESPKKLYLSGSALGQPALQIGSNPDRYWLGVMRDPSQFYWGYWKFVDQECNTWRMGGPVRLLEALGQVSLRSLDGKMLGPVLQRQNGMNVLMYMAVDETSNWYIAKQVFITGAEPLTISKIIYYKPDGKEELSITYSDYRDAGAQGRMANRVDLTWPDEKSYLRLTLGSVSPVSAVPGEAFMMPDPATFSQVEQVDVKCK